MNFHPAECIQNGSLSHTINGESKLSNAKVSQGESIMSPGKIRLATGICCVGTLVVLGAGMLLSDAPRELFPATPTSASEEFLYVLAFFMGVAVLMLPFDLMGGIFIPASFESRPADRGVWLRQWFRSMWIQSLFFSVTFCIYLQIGRGIGAVWLIAMFAALQVSLVAGQELLWHTMTANWSRTSSAGKTSVLGHSDQRFAGGITGLPGFETIVVPRDWDSRLRPSSLNMLVNRRHAAITSGGRLHGIIFAMAWNVAGFTLAIIAVNAVVVSVADLVSVYLWFLLYSFAGLLILPIFNRRGVFALDRHVMTSRSYPEFCEAITDVDRLTEQDPERSASEESVFQPIPCPERRIKALSVPRSGTVAAWNVARTTLFLSWAFGGPLARAVHCNVGRPELWAMMPVD